MGSGVYPTILTSTSGYPVLPSIVEVAASSASNIDEVIEAGPGSPNGSVSGINGSIYLRDNSPNGKASAFVDESSSTTPSTSGWNPILTGSLAGSLTATGSTQGTALVLTARNNFVTTVAAGTGAIFIGGSGVTEQYVYNDGANALLVYPPSGASIQIGTTLEAPNTPVSLPPGDAYEATTLPSTNLQVVPIGWINLSGTSGSIGGSALAAGACLSGTVSIPGATTSMAVQVTPVTYPGDSVFWKGYVSSAGTVTAKVCEVVAGTPTASTYNVRVIQ